MKLSTMLRQWPRSFLFRSPYTCNIKITTRCNLRCGFCGLWARPVTNELATDAYRAISTTLKATGLARAVNTGAEPLLRPDAAEIIGMFSRRGISTTLLTNGTLLTPSRLDSLCRAGLDDIGISLDSLQPEQLGQICGRPGIWPTVVNAIRLSVDRLTGGVVQVMTTVTRTNLNELPELIHFICTDLGAWSVINPVNVAPDTPSILSAHTDIPGPPMDPAAVDRAYDAVIKMKRDGLRILVSDRFLADSRHYLKTGEYAWRCDAGERYFTIFPDGALAPCSDQAPVRNIMTMKPADFRSRAYRDTVRSVQRRCKGCIFSCWREASYLFSDPSAIRERTLGLHRVFRRR
ncbi:radical SAM protein [bacterium]|nr:radical SAM protein [candidate division CSSED10-310 bacterium]